VIELRILGPLELTASDERDVEAVARQSKRAALLSYLAAALPRGLHRRDRLLTLFWPESSGPRARAALSQAVYVLRTTLGERAIVTRGDQEVGLDPEAVWCDAVAFESALDAGNPAAALELYRGDLLDGFFATGAPEFDEG
jgi:serine/threonine-protein kinase